MKKLSSLKFTAALLVAFLLLTFWGTVAQAQAGDALSTLVVERFFGSYFIWILGVLPLPAFKGVALLACVNLVASLVFRMPRGWKNVGLWLMHVALLVLLAGGVLESELRKTYNGYRMVVPGAEGGAGTADIGDVVFFAVDDSLNVLPVAVPENDYAYNVTYRGRVEGMMGVTVDMYSAAYDPLRFVPYAFMALFLLGAVFHYAVKVRGAQRNRNAKVGGGLKAMPLFALAVLVLPIGSRASDNADAPWASINPCAAVLVDSVVRPFDSFARGFLDDLNGRVTYKCKERDDCSGKIPASLVVGKIARFPEKTDRYALFKVLRGDVSEALHLPAGKRYVSYADLALSRDLLELYASRNDGHRATLEMRRLYSNLREYEAVKNGTAFSVIEKESPLYTKLDWRRISTEVFYHRANLGLWSFIASFAASLLASLNLIFKSKKLDLAANGFCALTAGLLIFLFALRAYVASRVPLASLYEIVLLVALLLVSFESGAFLVCRRRTYSLVSPVTLLAVLLLFFARFILEGGDTFRPIPAVLNSSVFITLHVFTIALGFAGMILSGIVAHLVLFRGARALPSIQNPKGSPLYSLLQATLAFGAMFTVVGTLLGGVWADFAWGRFWGFDPKECGALFVILWAMLSLHLRSGKLISPRGFALMNCFNVIVTFLCWFGINMLGVGLHSYGFQSGSVAWLVAFVVVDSCAVVALALKGRGM